MTKFLNISVDDTLGGSSASDETVSSQKAIKGYVDGYALHNTASYPADGLKVLGAGSVSGHYATVIGVGADDGGYGGVTAVGYNSGRSSSYVQNATALGANAKVGKDGAIQIGAGTNSESCSLSIGFRDYNNTDVGNYKLLGSTGLIPIERLGGDSTSTNNKYLKENGTWGTISGGWSPPDQTGNAGKFLTTDGSDTSWASITIPTVNNATLTIQKNGTDVATFTANSSTNTTANISVPTQASDISALDTNASNITSTGKETIVGWGMPDYTAGVAKTVGTQYTAEQNGFIKIDIINSSWGSLVIDGVTVVGTLTNNASLCALSFVFPIAKGQVYTATGVYSITFYPAKGG